MCIFDLPYISKLNIIYLLVKCGWILWYLVPIHGMYLIFKYINPLL